MPAPLLTSIQACTTDTQTVALIQESLDYIKKEIKYTKSSPFNLLHQPMAVAMSLQVDSILDQYRRHQLLRFGVKPLPAHPTARKLFNVLIELETTPLPFCPNWATSHHPKRLLSRCPHHLFQNDALLSRLNFNSILNQHKQSICDDNHFNSMDIPYSKKQREQQRAHLLKQGYRFLFHYRMLKQAHQKLTTMYTALSKHHKPTITYTKGITTQPTQPTYYSSSCSNTSNEAACFIL